MSKTSLINMILASIGVGVGEREARVITGVLVNVLWELDLDTSFLLSVLSDIRIHCTNNNDPDGLYITNALIEEFK